MNVALLEKNERRKGKGIEKENKTLTKKKNRTAFDKYM